MGLWFELLQSNNCLNAVDDKLTFVMNYSKDGIEFLDLFSYTISYS